LNVLPIIFSERERGFILSIGAINNVNPLQRQFGVPQGFGAAQAAPAANNPFAAANPLGQGANNFSAGFGAQQQGGGIEALLASAAGAKKEEPKEDGMKEILTLIMSLIGKGEGSAKAKQGASVDTATGCADGSCGSASGCEDANADGICDAGGEECVDNDGDGECDACPDGSCG